MPRDVPFRASKRKVVRVRTTRDKEGLATPGHSTLRSSVLYSVFLGRTVPAWAEQRYCQHCLGPRAFVLLSWDQAKATLGDGEHP